VRLEPETRLGLIQSHIFSNFTKGLEGFIDGHRKVGVCEKGRGQWGNRHCRYYWTWSINDTRSDQERRSWGSCREENPRLQNMVSCYI
jgi:hypothetical protein